MAIPADAAKRLDAVRDRIASACARAGRDPASVTLIAVSKTRDAGAIAPLIAQGQLHFGENRVQEAAAKWPPLVATTPALTLHMVGQLQSNKADDAAGLFAALHSIDRASLVRAVARAFGATGRPLPCFVQVNIGAETQKGGCPIDELPDLIALAREQALPVAGLMAVPPAGVEPAPFFALLAELAARHGLAGLSMGMSDDYETAVMLGATHVRVGSALFGVRD